MDNMLKLTIQPASKMSDEEWDKFIADSYNGAFVSTRKFLNYHPKNRFIDHSLMFCKNDTPVAVVPACETEEDGKKIFFSHKGATFGGIIVDNFYFNTTYLQSIIGSLDNYLKGKDFKQIILKQAPSIFSRGPVDTLDYLLSINGYRDQKDLTFIVDVKEKDDILGLFRENIRQQIKQGYEQGLVVREITNKKEISKFHNLLGENLNRHNAKPIHSVGELLDLKDRFKESSVIKFYCCYKDDKMIGGAMTWQYRDLLHLQNIAIDYNYQSLRPANVINDYLINLCLTNSRIRYFSFGSSTEDDGQKLNFGLARFKEGFGARGFLKNNYSKEL